MSTNQALTLLALAVGVSLAPFLSGWLRVPDAVSAILYGAVLVAVLPALAHPPSFATFLAHFGFLLLMFLAGLELDVRPLIAGGPGHLLRTVPFALAVPVGSILAASGLGFSAFLGLMVGAISIGLAVPVLTELGLSRSPVGQAALLTGGIGELLTVVAMTVLSEATGALRLRLVEGVGKLLIVFCIGYAVLTLLRGLAWWHPAWFARLLGHQPTELGLRTSIALLVAFAALANLLRVEDILAAFVAGLALGFVFPTRETADPVEAAVSLRGKLSSTGFGFFVPIFFISVGEELDLRGFLHPTTLALAAAILIASSLVRLLALPLLRLQMDWGDAVLLAVLLSAPLSLQVAVAELGVSLHALPEQTLNAAVAAATVGAVLYPVLFRILGRRSKVEPSAAGGIR